MNLSSLDDFNWRDPNLLRANIRLFVYALQLHHRFLWNKNNTNNSVPQIGNR